MDYNHNTAHVLPNNSKKVTSTSYHVNVINNQCPHLNSMNYYSSDENIHNVHASTTSEYNGSINYVYKTNCGNIQSTNMNVKPNSPNVDIKAFVEDINNTDLMMNIHESNIIASKNLNLPGLQGLAQIASNIKSSKDINNSQNLVTPPLHIQLPGSSPYVISNSRPQSTQDSNFISQTLQNTNNFNVTSNSLLNLPSFSSFMNNENSSNIPTSLTVTISKVSSHDKVSFNSDVSLSNKNMQIPSSQSLLSLDDTLITNNLNAIGSNVSVPENEIQSIINANINLLGTWQKQLQAMSAFYTKGLSSMNDKLLTNNPAFAELQQVTHNLNSQSLIPNIQIVQNNNVNNINHNTMNLLNNLAPLLKMVNQDTTNLSTFNQSLNPNDNIASNSNNVIELLKKLSSLGLININESTLLALSNPLSLLQIQQFPNSSIKPLEAVDPTTLNYGSFSQANLTSQPRHISQHNGFDGIMTLAHPKIENSPPFNYEASPFGVLNAAVALKQLIKNEPSGEQLLLNNKLNMSNIKPEDALIILNSANALLTGNSGMSATTNSVITMPFTNNNCPFCSKTFKFKSNLHTHVKAVHKKIKPHACTICSKSFSLKQNMKTHIKNIHHMNDIPEGTTAGAIEEKEKLDKSINSLESSSTTSAKSLKLNRQMDHSGGAIHNRSLTIVEENEKEEYKLLQTPDPNASYSSLEDQYRNLLLSAAAAQVAMFGNTGSGNKINMIPSSDVQQNFSSSLPKQRNKLGRKPKSHVFEHKEDIFESINSDNKSDGKNSRPVGAPRKNQNDKNLIFCPKCSKSFTLKGNFNVHMKIVHEKTRDFECNFCSKKFGLKANMTMHLNNVHKNKEEKLANQTFNCTSDLAETSVPDKKSHKRGRPRRSAPATCSDMGAADSFTSQVLSEIAREKMSSLVGEPFFNSKLNSVVVQSRAIGGNEVNQGNPSGSNFNNQQHSCLEQYTLDESLTFGTNDQFQHPANNTLSKPQIQSSLNPLKNLPAGGGYSALSAIGAVSNHSYLGDDELDSRNGNGVVDHAAAAAVYLQYLQHQQQSHHHQQHPSALNPPPLKKVKYVSNINHQDVFEVERASLNLPTTSLSSAVVSTSPNHMGPIDTNLITAHNHTNIDNNKNIKDGNEEATYRHEHPHGLPPPSSIYGDNQLQSSKRVLPALDSRIPHLNQHHNHQHHLFTNYDDGGISEVYQQSSPVRFVMAPYPPSPYDRVGQGLTGFEVPSRLQPTLRLHSSSGASASQPVQTLHHSQF